MDDMGRLLMVSISLDRLLRLTLRLPNFSLFHFVRCFLQVFNLSGIINFRDQEDAEHQAFVIMIGYSW